MFNLMNAFYSPNEGGAPEDPLAAIKSHLAAQGIAQEEKVDSSKEATESAPAGQNTEPKEEAGKQDGEAKKVPFERFKEVYSERTKFKSALEEVLANPEIKAILSGEAKKTEPEQKKDGKKPVEADDDDPEWLKKEVSTAVKDVLKELGLADMAKQRQADNQKAESETAYRQLVKEMKEIYPEFDEETDMPIVYQICEEQKFAIHPKVGYELAKARGKIGVKGDKAQPKQAHDIKGGKPPAPEKVDIRAELKKGKTQVQRDALGQEALKQMFKNDPQLRRLLGEEPQE